MAAVQLFKRKVKYEGSDKKEKVATNFYIKCGEEGELIAVDIHYFPNAACEGRDPGFLGRKAVMENYATTLPEKEE
ncbi:MAG: hypothetical protein IJ488_01610 [Clostridia bacterium]|nr:hypothetical protein [Clostridia bacterium]